MTTPIPPSQKLSVRGPGAVFETISAAATDGLAYSYLRAHEFHVPGRVHAGTIRAVEGGGYTYDGVVEAPWWDPNHVAYKLGKNDVAHFHTYPSDRERKINRANERHSSKDRRVVDELDPLHRPSFVLTPSLQIRAYMGANKEVLVVENLHDTLRDRSTLITANR